MQALPEPKTCDVLVVGLGPAGATAAYELSRAGISVIALEKDTHPRYKVCGGGLSARIDHILGSEFHTVVEQRIHGVQFTYQGKDPLVIDADEPGRDHVPTGFFLVHGAGDHEPRLDVLGECRRQRRRGPARRGLLRTLPDRHSPLAKCPPSRHGPCTSAQISGAASSTERRANSSAGSERLPYTQEVGGSNPSSPIRIRVSHPRAR